jgi:tRNA threonylcarbamoyl adenosine modification protein YeaZ
MIILACETSTLLGSVAVIENGKILSFEKSMRQGSHSDVLNITIEKSLASANRTLADIDIFATGIGPGSFTGLRISLNTIKTFAYCLQKPVIGIDSLYNLAFQLSQLECSPEFLNLPIVSMINAYKNMVYVGTYTRSANGLTAVKSPEVIRVQNLAGYLPARCLVSGDGFNSYQSFFQPDLLAQMIRLNIVEDEPTAQSLCLLAEKNLHLQIPWSQLLPLYLRASEAEENLLGIKYQPLI